MNAHWLKYLPLFLRNRLIGRHHIQLVMGNTSWLMVDKVIRYGLGVVIGLIIARQLGPSEFGTLSYATAFVGMFTILATLGIDSVVVQKLVLNLNDKKGLLGTAFVLKLTSSIFVIFLTYLSIFILKNNEPDIQLIVLVLALGLVFQPFEVVDCFFQSKTKSKPVVLSRVAGFILSSGLKIGVIVFGGEIIHLAIATLIEAFVTAFFLVIAYRNVDKEILLWRFDTSIATKILKASWPVLFSGSCVAITMQIDKVLLGEMRSTYEVGLYSVANQFSSVWNIFPVVIGASLAPTITRLYALNSPRYFVRLQQIYVFMTYLSLIAAAFVSFISDDIIRFLFGPHYANSGNVLEIHIWTAIFVFHTSIRSRSLLIEGKQRYIAIFAFLTLIANLLLNLILIGPFGMIGAAFSFLGSWFLCVAVFPLFWDETRESAFMFYKSFVLSKVV